MKIQKVVFVLIGMILFTGMASAQQVKTDYDRGANFAQYKTYFGNTLRRKIPWMSIASRMPSMPPWQQKAGAAQARLHKG